MCKVQTLQWKWTALLQDIQQLGERNSRIGSGQRWLDFVVLKPGSRLIFLKQIEKTCDATEVRTIVVIAIKEQQIDVDRQSSRVRFGNDIVEDILKCRFTYEPMSNIAKTERGISIMVLSNEPHKKFWIWSMLI